jgi:hypothetical protein
LDQGDTETVQPYGGIDTAAPPVQQSGAVAGPGRSDQPGQQVVDHGLLGERLTQPDRNRTAGLVQPCSQGAQSGGTGLVVREMGRVLAIDEPPHQPGRDQDAQMPYRGRAAAEQQRRDLTGVQTGLLGQHTEQPPMPIRQPGRNHLAGGHRRPR